MKPIFIPILRFNSLTGEYYAYCSHDDDRLFRDAGFLWDRTTRYWVTWKKGIARRLAGFGDREAREQINGPLNRYDPFLLNARPNELLPLP